MKGRNKKGQFIKGHKIGIGKYVSIETRRKISEANKGKCNRIGYKHSEKTKEKIRQAHLRRNKSWYKNCEYCGKRFKVYACRPNAKFCSNKCRAQKIMPPASSRIGRIPWNKNLTKETDERIKKLALDRTGKKNWMWKDGVTQSFRDKHKRELKRWREKVFKRDNWTCQDCGKRGRKLHPHHKKGVAEYPELAFVVSNGVTLCAIPCHQLKHKKSYDQDKRD